MFDVIKVTPVLGSVIFNSAERPTTIVFVSPSEPLRVIVRNSSISNLPAAFAFKSDSSAMFDAVPPTWNVRSVNCVPGSPID
ncbi:hypothetical protein D3C80_1246230 [compost metagenome]